jgi:hypothetical protein
MDSKLSDIYDLLTKKDLTNDWRCVIVLL